MPEGERILVTRSSMPPMEEYVREVEGLWESHWLTNMGEKHRRLEAELTGRLKVPHVSLFTNGHLALECAIEALGLGEDGRNRVITTPYTFASTTHAIVRRGLTPVFADVDPETLTMDPASAAALVDERTCAILPVHVYGGLCDDAALSALAQERGMALVYDAAHAFGVEYLRLDGTWAGAASMGDVSMLSFHATKVFNTVEGGALCYADEALGRRLAQWRNFGIEGPEDVAYAGGNAKMDELRAAMGLCNLRHVDGEIASRRVAAERYWERLAGMPGLRCLVPAAGVRHNYAYLPVLFDPAAFGTARDEVFEALDRAGVGARKYFYPLTCDYACYARLPRPDVPVARQAAARVLTLPLYAGLALEDVDRICDVVRGCAR